MTIKNTFKDLLTIPQYDLMDELLDYILDKGYKDYVLTEDALGFVSPHSNMPCLVAHLDTINTEGRGYFKNVTSVGKKLTELDRTPSEEDILFTENYILLSPEANEDIECLGGDDRVGVKTILDILDKGLMPHILFTTFEETGCEGSREIIQGELFDFLKEASMFIQVDRGVHAGYWNEMVFYSYDHTSIEPIFDELKKYYKLATGSYTDVAVLGPHYNKPIVNLSASYMNEHTRSEFINLNAYKHNTESLYNFLLWSIKQNTSEWVYTEKPKPAVTRGVYSQAPSYELKEPRELKEDMTVPEMVNAMYLYGQYAKDPKFSYAWDTYKKNKTKEGKESHIDDAEWFIKECYVGGVFINNYSTLNELFEGTVWYKIFVEDTEDLDDFEGFEEE